MKGGMFGVRRCVVVQTSVASSLVYELFGNKRKQRYVFELQLDHAESNIPVVTCEECAELLRDHSLCALCQSSLTPIYLLDLEFEGAWQFR